MVFKNRSNGQERRTYELAGTGLYSVNSTAEEVDEHGLKYNCNYIPTNYKVPDMFINCILDKQTLRSFISIFKDEEDGENTKSL